VEGRKEGTKKKRKSQHRVYVGLGRNGTGQKDRPEGRNGTGQKDRAEGQDRSAQWRPKTRQEAFEQDKQQADNRMAALSQFLSPFFSISFRLVDFGFFPIILANFFNSCQFLHLTEASHIRDDPSLTAHHKAILNSYFLLDMDTKTYFLLDLAVLNTYFLLVVAVLNLYFLLDLAMLKTYFFLDLAVLNLYL
jgi:hypothetical protein